MLLPSAALRSVWRDGYTRRDFRADVAAGVVVAIVALPLSMALAIAIGLPPQHGLYTAIVAGATIPLLGGSRTQVSGPTAAFVAVLLPIVQHHGLAGLLLSTLLAGAMMACLGLLRFGRFIQLVPYPVVAGFTAGIAITIASGQLAGLLGMKGVAGKAHFHEVLGELWRCLPTTSFVDLGIGLLTIALLIMVPRLTARVPAPLIAIVVATLLSSLLESSALADLVTVDDRFGFADAAGTWHRGVPPGAPSQVWPWQAGGPGGEPFDLDYARLRELLLAAVAIAVLGAIESLLSAVAADSMTGTRHDPDAELFAQGLGNVFAPFFGGFAATGAIARTATNIRSGAVSPVAAITHAGALLVAVMTITPVLGRMPIAAMSALLLFVAWRMADVRHVARVLRIAPRADRAVLVTCLGLTVAFDMVVGVVAGLVLACLLFLRRMAQLTGVRILLPDEARAGLSVPVPDGVLVYAIEGPLFFGAAERAMRALDSIGRLGATVVLDLGGVQTIDATGLVNLESALARLRVGEARTIVVAPGGEVADALTRAGIVDDGRALFVREGRRDAFELAAELAAAVQTSSASHSG